MMAFFTLSYTLIGFFSVMAFDCFAQKLNIGSYIFGDSLIDAGNNNYLVSLSKANFRPNGIDFDIMGGIPSGRFTNGRTVPDIIAEELGLGSYAPPYLDPSATGETVQHGVNYGSAGSGILNTTGYIFGGRINMDAQVDNYANTRQDMIKSLGKENASKWLQSSIFAVTIGSNDFLANYLNPLLPPRTMNNVISPKEYVQNVITKYKSQLLRLYAMDARKIVVTNVGPLGCIPLQRDANPLAGSDCARFPNKLAMSFNRKLKGILSGLNSDLEGAMFLYADSYKIVNDIFENFDQYGFENIDSACCRIAGRYGGLVPCAFPARVCEDRSKYFFWDAYHPSEAANRLIAKRVLDGNPSEIFPINLRQLLGV